MSRHLMSNSILHLSFLSLASASPLYIIVKPTTLIKRDLTTGTKAGLGVGIAVAVILLVLITTFFIIHVRHASARKREQAALAAEKTSNSSAAGSYHQNATTAGSEAGPETNRPGAPRRQKSVKDRLMGPLYRGSTIDMLPLPPKARTANENSKGPSTITHQASRESMVDKPWARTGESSPRPSFSSKRATRMMMMM